MSNWKKTCGKCDRHGCSYTSIRAAVSTGTCAELKEVAKNPRFRCMFCRKHMDNAYMYFNGGYVCSTKTCLKKAMILAKKRREWHDRGDNNP